MRRLHMKTYIQIHPSDLVAVALVPLKAGASLPVNGRTVILREDIPQGHKFALQDIPAGEKVIKYGYPIGTARTAIPSGGWVHTHNLKTELDKPVSYTYRPSPTPPPSLSCALAPSADCFFQGYRRRDGAAAIRNEIWILPTVGCVNGVASALARMAQRYKTEHIDCITAFTHPFGCSQTGEDQENTRKILAGLIDHPNAGGVLVLGLGCENSGVETLKKYIRRGDEDRVRFLVCQESGDEMADGLKQIEALALHTDRFRREPIACSELAVGLKCGGSDGLSGITANPVTGALSDLLVSMGAATILTEVPEMFGAETLLMDRCTDESVFADTVNMIHDFKDYFIRHGQTVYENPSPGNRAGGISTLEDKSLGCVQKSGSAPVTGVLAYGDRVEGKGLHLLSAPGNDLVAATALAASGAHMVLFTTGRGTPFASPVPTVKISSNTALAGKKQNWIDFDCGVLTAGASRDDLCLQLFDLCLRTASGRAVKSELAGFHDMAIFKQGVTL